MTLVESVKVEWQSFRQAPPGERFELFNLRQQALYPAWLRPFYLVLALFALAAGAVFAVIPGPAFVFFGLALALFAAQSSVVARKLDAAEVRVRRWWTSVRRRARKQSGETG